MARNPKRNTRPTNADRIEVLKAASDATRQMVSRHDSSIGELQQVVTRLEASGLINLADELKQLIAKKSDAMTPDAIAKMVQAQLESYVSQKGWGGRIEQLETNVSTLQSDLTETNSEVSRAHGRITAVADNLEATNERVDTLEAETVQKSPWLPLGSFVFVTAVVFLLQRWGFDNDTPWMAQLGLAVVIGGLSAWVLDKLPVKVRSRISIQRTTPAPAPAHAAATDPTPQPANQLAVRQDKVSAN